MLAADIQELAGVWQATRPRIIAGVVVGVPLDVSVLQAACASHAPSERGAYVVHGPVVSVA